MVMVSVGAGTYAGMVEKLDYLQTLGINCVELLPSQEFNELEYYSVSALAESHVMTLNKWRSMI